MQSLLLEDASAGEESLDFTGQDTGERPGDASLRKVPQKTDRRLMANRMKCPLQERGLIGETRCAVNPIRSKTKERLLVVRQGLEEVA